MGIRKGQLKSVPSRSGSSAHILTMRAFLIALPLLGSNLRP
jgi:hypothetical protein